LTGKWPLVSAAVALQGFTIQWCTTTKAANRRWRVLSENNSLFTDLNSLFFE
jgi:hypothetical protein